MKRQKVNLLDMKLLRQLILSTVITLLFMAALPAVAQPSKVTTAWNHLRYQEYDKARDAINEAIKNEKTMNDAKTWLYRAQAYRGIAESDALSKTEPDAAMEAFRSLKKAGDLDKDKEYADQLQAEFFALSFDLYNAASSAYNAGESDKASYGKAYERFMAFSEAESMMGETLKTKLHETLKENKIDPMKVQQLIGSSAQLSGNMEKALEYYNNLVNSGFNDAGVYVALAALHKQKGDTAAALSVLDKGMAVATEKRDVINSKLDILVRQKKNQEVISLGNEAIKLDPENVNIYIAMGNAYYEMQKPKEAEEFYAKALAKDPDGFNTNFSLGIALYEQGRIKYNASLDEKSATKAKVLEDEYTNLFTKAIPYMEKAHTKEPADKEVMQILAELYSKTGDYAKAKEYSDKAKK
jgi:tetratricopeptide (TPR) repeat protein